MEIPQGQSGELEQPIEQTSASKAKLIGIGIVIVIAIAAVIYFMYYNHASSAPVSTNNAYASKIYSYISSKPLTLQDMVAAVNESLSYVNASKEFALNYNGSIALGLITQLTGKMNMNFTFNIAYQKYGNNSRIDFFGHNLPLLGNFNASIFSLKKLSYLCTAFNPLSMLSGLGANSLNSSVPSVKCYPIVNANETNSSQGAISVSNMSVQSFLSYSSSLSGAVALANPKITQASYNGYKCTLLTANVSITNVSKLLMAQGATPNSTSSASMADILGAAKNTTVTISGPIKICYSNDYAVPVYISIPAVTIGSKSAAGNSTVSIAVTLAATKVSLQSNNSYVSTLTGPIVNASSSYAIPPITISPS